VQCAYCVDRPQLNWGVRQSTWLSPNRKAKRNMRLHDLLLNAALAAISWTPSLSQSTPQWTPRFGVIGGANWATVSGGYFPKASNRTGFAGGLIAVLPVAPRFAIQPELMFTLKGANSDSGGISETGKFDYIELPVLARFDIPTSGRVKPFIYGGPGVAYRTSCMLKAHYAIGAVYGIDGDHTVKCDELARQGQRVSPGVEYRRTDVDGIIGGGFAFDIGNRTITAGVRYDAGFVNVFNRNGSKNRVLSFVGTLESPFRK
jgi:Outer membrane protein beta-barrel domain